MGDGASIEISSESNCTTEPVTGKAYYVYGMMAYNLPLDLAEADVTGIDGISDVALLIDHQIAAIVSEVDSDVFGDKYLKVNMKETAWLKDHVRRHASVLSGLKQFATLVPLKFGTVCRTEAEVFDLITARRSDLERTFERLHDKKELGLRIHCQMDLLSQRVSRKEQSFDRSIDEMSKGMGNYLKSEIKDQSPDANRSAVQAILENCVRRSHVELLEVASEGVFKPVDESTDELGRTLIMSTAYLVPSSAEALFKKVITRLADEFGDLGFSFEQSGPWPPYHFVDIDAPDADSMSHIA